MTTAISTPPRLVTIGVIAAAMKEPIHRVRYILDTRPHIHPAAIAGNAKLYHRNAIAMVRHELTVIDARRSAKEKGGSRGK